MWSSWFDMLLYIHHEDEWTLGADFYANKHQVKSERVEDSVITASHYNNTTILQCQPCCCACVTAENIQWPAL